MKKTTRKRAYLNPKDLFWYCENTDHAPLRGGVVFLPGRGNTGYSMVRRYTEVFDFSNIGLFSVTPRLDKGWYPPPNNPNDQAKAVSGLPGAVEMVEAILSRISDEHQVPREKLIVVGFSMGAVTAVQYAAHIESPAAAVICHSGAILEPWNLPKAKHQMPVVLNHGQDDFCFDWWERYLPMKSAMKKQGYRLYYLEREKGNHQILHSDVQNIKPIFEDVYEKEMSYDAFQG